MNSNKIKHTPGPWKYTPKSRDIWNIESETTGEHIARVVSSMQPGGRFDDDARLIAAAPELLSALAGLLEELPQHIGKRDVKKHFHLMVREEAARAAIAKAERGQP